MVRSGCSPPIAGVCLMIRVGGGDRSRPHRSRPCRQHRAELHGGGAWRCCSCGRSPVGVFVSTVIIGIGISFNYPSLMAMTVDAVLNANVCGRSRRSRCSSRSVRRPVRCCSAACRRPHVEADRVSRRGAFLRHRLGGVVEGRRATIADVRGCLNSASQCKSGTPQWRRDPRRRTVLPRGAEPRQPVRRVVHHGREDHRDLLPAELSGDDPEAAQRRVLRRPPRPPSSTATGPASDAVPTPRRARRSGTCAPTSSAGRCA